MDVSFGDLAPFYQRLKTPKEGRSLHFSKGDKADIREQPNHLALFNAYKVNAYKENRVFHKIVHHLI